MKLRKKKIGKGKKDVNEKNFPWLMFAADLLPLLCLQFLPVPVNAWFAASSYLSLCSFSAWKSHKLVC
jgi:hypothetical protein